MAAAVSATLGRSSVTAVSASFLPLSSASYLGRSVSANMKVEFTCTR